MHTRINLPHQLPKFRLPQVKVFARSHNSDHLPFHLSLGALVALMLGSTLLSFVFGPPPSDIKFRRTPLSRWQFQVVSPEGSVKSQLTQNGNNSVIKISRDNHFVQFKLPQKNQELKQLDDRTLAYQHPTLPIETQYQALPNGLKEDIVIKERIDTNTFTSQMAISDLQMKTNTGGELYFFDKESDEYVFHFEKPFAFDSAGNTTYGVSYKLVPRADESASDDSQILGASTGIEYKKNITKLLGADLEHISSTATNYDLVLEVDPEWYFSPERQFPVTIDPTVVYTDTADSATDGTFYNTKPNTSGQKLTIDTNTDAYWALDEGENGSCAGGGDACDDSGNNYHATASGTLITTTEKISGASRYFDGVNDVLEASMPSYTMTDSFTISFWMKTAGSGGYMDIVYNTSGTGGIAVLMDPGGQLVLWMSSTTGNVDRIDTVGTYNDNQWHHVALVYKGNADATTSEIWVDGVEADVTISRDDMTSGQTLDTAGDYWVFGAGTSTGVNQYVGYLDELRIIGSSLVSDHIYELYRNPAIANYVSPDNRELAADENTVGLWRFEEGTANTCTGGTNDACDSSGNGHDGAFVGGTAHNEYAKGVGLYSADFVTVDTDYITVPDSNDFTLDAMTIETWIQSPFDMADAANLVGSWTGSNGFILAMTAGRDLWFYDGVWRQSSINIPLDYRWRHIAVTRDGEGSCTFYLNGDPVETLTCGTGELNGGTLYLGQGDVTSLTTGFRGRLDEVRISNVARTAKEIKASYRPEYSGYYISEVIDLGVASPDEISWHDLHTRTGDGETAVNTRGLVAEYKFNETSGTTATNTGSCGAACNGTLTNFSNTSGQDIALTTPSGWTANSKYGAGAINFDGTDDYVTVADNDALDPTEITLEAWIKPTESSTDSSPSNFIEKGANSGYRLRLESTSRKVTFFDRGGTNSLPSNSELELNTWHHVVAVGRRSGLEIYIDGNYDANNSVAYGAGNTTDTLTIGGEAYAEFFEGTIDTVRIYNRPLTRDEIFENYQASQVQFQMRSSVDGSTWSDWSPNNGDTPVEGFENQYLTDPTTPGLVAYWPMDETENDTCGNGNDVCDVVGNNHLNGNSTSISSGAQGNGRSFNNSSGTNYISGNTDTNIDLTTSGSVSSWVNIQIDSGSNPVGTVTSVEGTGDPNPPQAGDLNDGVSSVVLNNKLFYAIYHHQGATEYFKVVKNNLDGTLDSTATLTAPDGASAGGLTSVSIDTDGSNIYMVAFAQGAASSNLYIGSIDQNLSNFSGWTSVTSPTGTSATAPGSIDMVYTNNKLHLATMQYNSGTGSFQTARYDLGTTTFSGWTSVASAPSTLYAGVAISTAIDTDGTYIYYTVVWSDGTYKRISRSFGLTDGSFDGWVTTDYYQTYFDPLSPLFHDALIAGNSLYVSLYGYDASAQPREYHYQLNLTSAMSGSYIDGTAPSAHTYSVGESTSIAMATKGERFYKVYLSHYSNGTDGMEISYSEQQVIGRNVVLQKGTDYSLIRTHGGYVFYGPNRAYSFSEINPSEPNSKANKKTEIWEHVAVTYDGSSIMMYIDGNLVRTESATGSFQTNSSSLKLGLGYNSLSPFYGKVDELKIYSRALTFGEIEHEIRAAKGIHNKSTSTPTTKIKTQGSNSLAIINGRSDLTQSTQLYYSLDETNGDITGSDVFDASGLGRHGEFTTTTPTSVAGKVGRARSFTYGDEITATGYTGTPTSFYREISFWLKMSDTGLDHAIVGWGDQTQDGKYAGVNVNYSQGNVIEYECGNGGVYGNTPVADGKWHRVTVVLEINCHNTNIFVDGNLESKTTYGTNFQNLNTSSTNYVVIGNDQQDTFFQGILDEFKISSASFDNNDESRLANDQSILNADFNIPISSTDLSSSKYVSIDIAGDKTGIIGNLTLQEDNDFANYIPDANTVAYWPLDGNLSGLYTSTLGEPDLVSKHIAEPSGTPVLTEAEVGNGYRLDNTESGATDTNYFIVDQHSDFALNELSAFTVDGWVKIKDVTNLQPQGLMGTWDTSVGWIWSARLINDASMSFHTLGSWVDSGIQIAKDHTWKHVAFTYDNGTCDAYINGLKVNSQSCSAVAAEGQTGLYLGAGGDGWWNTHAALVGSMSDLRISNVARTEDDIKKTYETNRRRFDLEIDFVADLETASTICSTSETNTTVTINAKNHGLTEKADKLLVGEKIIFKENYGGVEYLAQGTVSAVTPSSGSVTVSSWDSGSTIPSGCFTTNATVMKWQTVIFDLNEMPADQRDAITNLQITTPDTQGLSLYVDNFRAMGENMIDETGSTITAPAGRYVQYRTLFTTSSDRLAQIGNSSLTTTSMTYQTAVPSSPAFTNTTSPDNIETPDTTPEIRFSGTDADSDDLVYQVRWDTDSDFANATLVASDADAGFANVDTPADTSPFTQGETVSYTFQSALSDATTYFYQVRASDQTGSIDWYDLAWADRVKITIPASKINSTLTNFPVLVDLSTLPAGFWTNVDAAGDDIVVTSSDGMTKLDRELVSINTGTDTGELWFKAPSLSSSTDTTFYIYYNNAAASETNSTNVWSNNYAAVWHMTEDPSGTAPQIQDSTANNLDGTSTGTMTSGDVVTGKIASATDFDGADDTVSSANDAFTQTNNFSASVWVNMDTINDGSAQHLLAAFGRRWGIVEENGNFQAMYYDGTNQIASSPASTGSWTHLTMVKKSTGSGIDLYVNGQLANSNAATSNVVYVGNTPTSIGGDTWSYPARSSDAQIDEARINSSILTADWIAAEYSNQANPDNFYYVDSPETFATAEGYGGWSNTYSFTTNTNLDTAGWLQTHADQFALSANLDPSVSLNTTSNWIEQDEPGVATVSATVSIGDYNSEGNWGIFRFQDSHTGGDIRYRFYYDNAGTPTLIPDGTLAGNSTGFTESGINLTGVSASTYPTLTLEAEMTLYSGVNTLNEWQFTFNDPPNVPTLDSPLNAATGVSYDALNFLTTATDPDSDNLKYTLNVCEDSGMTTNCQVADQTTSASGWLGMDADTNTTYASGTQANYSIATGPDITLALGTTYYWKSYAIDPSGSNIAGPTQATPYSFTTEFAPSAPTGLETEAATNPTTVADSTPEFSAIHNDTDSDSATYYQIEVSTDNTFATVDMWDSTKTAITVANGARSALISYSGSALSTNTTYYWRIRFWDSADVAGTWSATANFTTGSHSAPEYCSVALNPTTPSYTFTWTDNSQIETSYVIERSVNGGAFSSLTSKATDVTSHEDTTISPNTNYSYRVKAANNTGFGDSGWCTTSANIYSFNNFMSDGVSFEGLRIQ